MFARSHQAQPSGNSERVANDTSSRRAFRDVSNVGRNTNNGSKVTVAGKPVVAKRSTNGVKTRSMSNGGTAREEPIVNVDAFQEERKQQEAIDRTSGRNLADPNSYQITGNSDDIDDRDKDDPLCATAYVRDMYTHFREKEMTTTPSPTFMDFQIHLNDTMRSILVDWLVEVHNKFKLVPETLYLTVNLIDRYLEREQVERHKLQLVGVTCLLIASKYEEIYPPEMRDLVYICDSAYEKEDIISMEEQVLKTLMYKITIPSGHAFLVRFLKAGHADKKIVQLSCYLLDITLQHYSMLNYLPSQLAAATVFIARRVVGRNGWSPTLLAFSDYAEEEIIPIARAILEVKQTENPKLLKAINKKYSSNRYGCVSSIPLPIDF